MLPTVFRIFRETLEYAAAKSCGDSMRFSDEVNSSLILEAERLSGLQDEAVSNGPGLLSIFNVIRPDQAAQYASMDARGLFDGYQADVQTDVSVQFRKWKELLKTVPDEAGYAQTILEYFEDCFSAVPSLLPGVSCYHWGKTMASIACCLMYNREREVNSDRPFVLYSIDFSGIQKFIYTIISTGALKALKTRSLYLSVLSEHISDMILAQCSLPRCNLIYVGGGRAHLLLSSDREMVGKANGVVASVNQFLKKNFGTSLFLASGLTEASGDDLHSHNGVDASFSELFRNTSRMISENKLRRYTYGEIRELNHEPMDTQGRTCAICGRSVRIIPWKDGKHLCKTCAGLEEFSVTMTDECDTLYVTTEQTRSGLPVPGPGGEIYTLTAEQVPEDLVIRKYLVNRSDPASANGVRIYMSRHHAKPLENGNSARFDTMVAASEGIHRLGVFRGDVDSLGALFANGFHRPSEAKAWQKCNMSYYSALSGALTWFFQRNLDRVIREGHGSPLLKAHPHGEQVTVVYAGGDDVFLVGAWHDVLDASLRIQDAFRTYTGGAVTLSGGYSFFPEKTPVPVMADTTADLEEEAKQHDGKNAISLFGQDGEAGGSAQSQCYGWDEFRSCVLDGKLPIINRLFGNEEDKSKGNSFLYHVLGYFRKVQTDPMAITRLAYLLARHKPSERNKATDEMTAAYQDFMKKTYAWALNEEENRAFRTACLIYVYLNRKVMDNDATGEGR